MSLYGSVGTPVHLSLLIDDGRTDQYPQAYIYKAGETTTTAIVDMASVAGGLYSGFWTPTENGSYAVLFIIYYDAAHTIDAFVYTRAEEQIQVYDRPVPTCMDGPVAVASINLVPSTHATASEYIPEPKSVDEMDPDSISVENLRPRVVSSTKVN